MNGSFIDPEEKLYMLLLQDSLTQLEVLAGLLTVLVVLVQ